MDEWKFTLRWLKPHSAHSGTAGGKQPLTKSATKHPFSSYEIYLFWHFFGFRYFLGISSHSTHSQNSLAALRGYSPSNLSQKSSDFCLVTKFCGFSFFLNFISATTWRAVQSVAEHKEQSRAVSEQEEAWVQGNDILLWFYYVALNRTSGQMVLFFVLSFWMGYSYILIILNIRYW